MGTLTDFNMNFNFLKAWGGLVRGVHRDFLTFHTFVGGAFEGVWVERNVEDLKSI